MILATDYYPEHWPENRWEEDAKLMQQAHITRVRMGEFAWHGFEPADGHFDFDWMIRAIDLLGRYGIDVILGTPTAAYPPWLHKKCPDIHQIKSSGRSREYGQRQDACRNHPVYREHALRITRKMLEALGEHTNVVAWQIDNEFGGHQSTFCYCTYCEKAFRKWLSEKFKGDIDALNDAWGTVFWSQTYNDFDEISVPRDAAENTQMRGHNPARQLDYRRFCSDSMIEFNREQARLIRKLSPGRIVTHNLVGTYWNEIDYFKLARDLDVVSWDNYPFGSEGRLDVPPIFPHNLMYGLKAQPTWIMEQAAGPGGWDTFCATPRPHRMRLWACQCMARGADMVTFFRWRSCRFGTEQYWHGVLYHHGIPQRRYQECKQIGSEFASLTGSLQNSRVCSDIALLFDYDSLWAYEIQPHLGKDISYVSLFNEMTHALASMGLGADVVGVDSDFGTYKILIAPSAHICPQSLADKLETYVQSGGTLILGCRSGVKDENSLIVNELLPGPLRNLCGCHVEEYDAFSTLPDAEVFVEYNGNSYPARGLAEILRPADAAEAIMRYRGRYYTGAAAATSRPFGEGRVVYIGTNLPREALTELLMRQCDRLGIGHTPNLSEGLEIARRTTENGPITFYLNHSDRPQKLKLLAPGADLLTNQNVKGKVTLPPLDVLIVQE